MHLSRDFATSLLLAACLGAGVGVGVGTATGAGLGVGALDAPWEKLIEEEDEARMHPQVRHGRSSRYSPDELGAAFWLAGGQSTLRARLAVRPQEVEAKNVVLFIGDGMSIPTLVASRIYQGQLQGADGEEHTLSFERFPYTGLSRTYCVDSQVADSACSATAYFTGVKTNDATLGVTANVNFNNCSAMNDPDNRVSGLITWAQAAGKRTGIVTTTRVTHASPAGGYAHTANRDWENDAVVVASGHLPGNCMDIAKQLVTTEPGKSINVVLGGGRREFRSLNVVDEEGSRGARLDSEDLIEKWRNEKQDAGKTASYVWDRSGLLGVDPESTEYLLGLFEASHTQYHLDSNPTVEPSLSEMVATAIEVLQRGPKGFFLFVEGGRIDHAHHDTLAHKALDETVQMALAVETVLNMTSPEDTLVVVTSDHAHTMSVSGYPTRGNPIFAATGVASDKLPYSTLGYANGPGYKAPGPDGTRYDLSQDDLTDKDYQFPSMAPMSSETHGGDDVAVFATGPFSHLFTGSFEQNYIPHAMAYAACMGDGDTFCEDDSEIRHHQSSNQIHY